MEKLYCLQTGFMNGITDFARRFDRPEVGLSVVGEWRGSGEGWYIHPNNNVYAVP